MNINRRLKIIHIYIYNIYRCKNLNRNTIWILLLTMTKYSFHTDIYTCTPITKASADIHTRSYKERCFGENAPNVASNFIVHFSVRSARGCNWGFQDFSIQNQGHYFQWLKILFWAVTAGVVLSINIVGSMVPTQIGPSFQSHWTNNLVLNQFG